MRRRAHRICAVEEGGQDGEVGGQDVGASLEQRLRAREVARPRFLRPRIASVRDLRSVGAWMTNAMKLSLSVCVPSAVNVKYTLLQLQPMRDIRPHSIACSRTKSNTAVPVQQPTHSKAQLFVRSRTVVSMSVRARTM